MKLILLVALLSSGVILSKGTAYSVVRFSDGPLVEFYVKFYLPDIADKDQL